MHAYTHAYIHTCIHAHGQAGVRSFAYGQGEKGATITSGQLGIRAYYHDHIQPPPHHKGIQASGHTDRRTVGQAGIRYGHYIAMHLITLHYTTLHNATLHYITLHRIAIQYTHDKATIQSNPIQCTAILYNAMHHDATHYNGMGYDCIQHYTNTIQMHACMHTCMLTCIGTQSYIRTKGQHIDTNNTYTQPYNHTYVAYIHA